jgi:hypothetical protein
LRHTNTNTYFDANTNAKYYADCYAYSHFHA